MRDLRRHFFISLFLGLAIFCTGWLGMMLPAFGSTITLIWLPTGIGVAVLFRWGFRWWPGLALGGIAANLAVGTPWPVVLGIAVGNILAPMLAAWTLRRVGFHPAFDRSRDILLLAGAAALGMLISSSIGVTALSLGGVLLESRLAAWLTWWAGDSMGVILAAPLVLTFTREVGRALLRRGGEFLVWLAMMTVVTCGVFVFELGLDEQAWELEYVPLVLVVWAALRFGAAGTSFALILLSFAAAYGTATVNGPFHRADPIAGCAVLWFYMAISAVLGWLVTALHAARVQATGVQRLFEQALTDVSLGVLLAGLDRRITYANEGFTRLTGYPEAELLGKSCAILQGPETDPETAARLKASLHGDGFFDGEILNYRKDGTRFWNALLVSPVRDERGVMTGFLGLQRDVTQRKQAEFALHQSEEHLRTIIELEPECVKIMSPEGKLLEMNPAGLAMIEACSLDEVRGLPLSELIVPEDRAVFAEMHRQVMGGAAGRCEFAIVTLKGMRRWLETNAVPYRNAQREIIGVLGITRDITQRRAAAAELEHSLSTLQLFINTVPAYISFVDAEERYRLVNKSYEEYFGLPADRLVGQRLRDMQSAEAYAEMQPHIRTALGGQTVRYQSHPTGPDGRSYWLDVQYVPRRGGNAAVTGFFVLVFDISESKQTEAALRDSRSRLDSILNSMEDVVWSTTPDAQSMIFVSASAEALYGRPASEFLADPMKWLAAVHPEDRAAAERAFTCMAETGEFDGEYRIIRSDGTVRWVHDRARTVNDADGHPLRIDGIMTDITERKVAEDRFRKLIEHAPEAIMLLDTDSNWAGQVNPAAERLFKMPAAELCRVGPMEMSPPFQPDGRPSREKGREFVARAMAGETPVFEWTHRDVEGRDIPCEVRLLRLEIGGHTVVRGSITDITGRKRAEQERTELLHSLEESQVRLQTLVSNLPGMAYRCLNDPNWTMSYVSEGCEAVTGWRRDELENNRAVAYANLIHPDDRDWLWDKCQKSLDGRTPCQNEYRILDRQGRERWVSERASGVYAPDGTLLAIDGFIQDITAARQTKLEREQLDRKMQETQKLESLGVLAGGIAHDFNNLLTAILGNASIAQTELPPGSSAQDCLEHITEASLRAADLCKQMLAYSGRGRFVVQTLDLGELVEQTAQMLQISISKKAVLRYRLEKGLPPIEVDATQIRQVIMNLVINASEAIGDASGVISISTGLARIDRDYLRGTFVDHDLPEGDYISLEVSDSGSGMSAETQARIFDPFFTTKFTGRGLGLAAVLGIVRGHRGALKVYSELGRGTTFKLLFPAASGAGDTVKPLPEAVPAWHGAGTVLVVDDEETMRSTVARMMRKMGLDPVLAADGREAVEVFRPDPGRFAFVLLDLTMPRMDGEQTFTELRRIHPEVRVVLMSGFNSQDALVRFSGKGLASFLQKPFTIDALRSTAQAVLGDKSAETA